MTCEGRTGHENTIRTVEILVVVGNQLMDDDLNQTFENVIRRLPIEAVDAPSRTCRTLPNTHSD